MVKYSGTMKKPRIKDQWQIFQVWNGAQLLRKALITVLNWIAPGRDKIANPFLGKF
jgi:hypothetical protein